MCLQIQLKLSDTQFNISGDCVMADNIYLELSEDNGSSHKFYKITIDGANLTINYGRIGTPGQTMVKSFNSHELAASFSQSKVKAQKRKGYDYAVKGVRKHRAIRAVVSRPSASNNRGKINNSKSAPVIATYKTQTVAFGIFVDADNIYVGDETGRVSVLSHDYELLRQYKLPAGTKCIVGDGANVYAGTNQGHVYEITGKIARLTYDCPGNAAIFWMDLRDGVLAVSDNEGGLFAYDYEGDLLFSNATGNGNAWMVRVDETGIFHGGNHVARYTFDGEKLWSNATSGVLFGYQTDSCLYAGGKGVVMIDKIDGRIVRKYPGNWVPSNCTSERGSQVFAQNNNDLKCWKKSGESVFTLRSPNSGMSMQYFSEKLYIVGDKGLAVIDVSDDATQSAQNDVLPNIRSFKAPSDSIAEVDSTKLENAKKSARGVELVCIRDNGKLRVRVLTDGYDKTMNCQFPKNLRQEEALYLVDSIELSSSGSFYKVSGNIYAR